MLLYVCERKRYTKIVMGVVSELVEHTQVSTGANGQAGNRDSAGDSSSGSADDAKGQEVVVFRASEVFGGMFMLRLMVKLPELFARSEEARTGVRRSPAVIGKLNELVNFMDSRREEFFQMDYTTAAMEAGSGGA